MRVSDIFNSLNNPNLAMKNNRLQKLALDDQLVQTSLVIPIIDTFQLTHEQKKSRHRFKHLSQQISNSSRFQSQSPNAPARKRAAWKLPFDDKVLNKIQQIKKIELKQSSPKKSGLIFSPKIKSSRYINRKEPKSRKIMMSSLQEQLKIENSQQEKMI